MGGREVGGPGRWRGLRIRRVGVMGSFEGLSGGLVVFRRTFRGSWGLSKDVQGVLGSFEALVWGRRVWRSLSKDTLEPRSLLTGVLGSEFFAYF